ncbi:hypothetical protein R1sor_010788 [Riccia sorocarpa]|uniref:Uncharacterized protein n=1 Tax=Riccia sorocarpa TaxID=122646 RepID=A0ABD3I1S9_9MARC
MKKILRTRNYLQLKQADKSEEATQVVGEVVEGQILEYHFFSFLYFAELLSDPNYKKEDESSEAKEPFADLSFDLSTFDFGEPFG